MGRVRDGAGGHEVGADVGVVANVSEGDAAGEFHLGAAGDFADPVGGFVRREVVQQEVLRAAFQGLMEFLAGAHLDLDDRVVPVRMFADAVVVEQPMAVTEVDAFGNRVHFL